MIIDWIGCCHGHFPKLEGGDLLIVTGDLTAGDLHIEYQNFFQWLKNQNYKKKIFIAGNHDNRLTDFYCTDEELNHFEYLCDSGTEFENLRIWGSPWTKTFPGMNPKCKAFTVDTEEELAEKWALIPEDVHILITHTPPYGILDGIDIEDGSFFHVGSKTLFQNWDGGLKLHIFSHIHEGYGEVKGNNGIFPYHYVNCSHVNERYQPVNKPVRNIL